MNQVTLTSSADNAFEVSMTPIIITPMGKAMKDRVNSVLATGSASTALSLLGKKGTVGKQAALAAAGAGVAGVVQQASNSNFRPMAERLAILLNCTVIVRTRADYDYMPTIVDMKIMDAESKGTDAGAKAAAKLREIKTELVDMMADAQAIFDAKKAAREDAKEAARLAAEAGITDVEAKPAETAAE